MIVKTDSIVPGALTNKEGRGQNLKIASGSFAQHLEKEMKMASNTANAGVNQYSLENDLSILKKKGFAGYFKELQARRIEELRKKILMEMGITEEDLGKMEPEQRAAIEKIVSQEIQRRLAAESAMDDDSEDSEENFNQGVLELSIFGKEVGFDFMSAAGES